MPETVPADFDYNDFEPADFKTDAQFEESLIDKIGNLYVWNRMVTRYRLFLDKNGLTDTRLRTSTLYRVFIDKVGNLDSKTTLRRIYRSITDSIGLLDARQRIASMHRSFIDKIGEYDVFNTVLGTVTHFFRTIYEFLGCLDARSRISSLHRLFTEEVELKDTKLKTVTLYRIFIEKLSSITVLSFIYRHSILYYIYKYLHKEHPKQKIQKSGI